MKQYNREQLQAIETFKGPVKVVAGAGTGKTTVLVGHFKNLVENHNVSPERIACFAFNKKARYEMIKRLEYLKNENIFTDFWINTFHSFALQFIREEYVAAKLVNRNFDVLDENSAKRLYTEIKDIFLSNYEKNEEAYNKWKEVTRKIDSQILMHHIERIKIDCLKRLDELTHEDVVIPNDNDEYKEEEIFYLKYAINLFFRRQIDLNSLDYEDLIIYNFNILKNNPDIRRKWQSKFDHILVDEFQDIDGTQYQIIKYLAIGHKNIFIVGDPDQCIYEWRRADINILLNIFDNDFPNAKIITLNENYRSPQNILDVANNIINHNTKRINNIFKHLNSKIEANPRNIVSKQFYHFKDELYWLIQTIKNFEVQKNFNFKNIMVVFRSKKMWSFVEIEFKKNNIPYVIYGKSKFFESKEVKTFLSYLTLIIKESDQELLNVINFPARKVGKKSLQKYLDESVEQEMSFYNWFFAKTDFKEPLKNLQEILIKYRNQINNFSKNDDIKNLVTSYITELNLFEFFGEYEPHHHESNKQRVENLNEVIQLFTNEFNGNDPIESSINFLNQFIGTDISEGNEENKVILSTIHAAKGLEFDIVFIPFLCERIFPNGRSIAEGNKEEEYRLAYVAITRAKKYLYLSNHSMDFTGNYFKPSTFYKVGKIQI
ncbi:hypothetical protein ASO20_02100 [Mycoplasma sp. (ex Biomphalaria glabrata)]|uniref:ATP-dependent helicase n=1 Tax=Mycoplasma sp. (ex Biomphalaria glabrata) TaxID=1749074 RepID=UPI00073ADB48|nr:ATP-dependent helicase [Mycoplasma sp. (ex Biomphalaria glabrata)]ALV23434.1 hypothetical protein ASO20_02100 [Mycoplasma sp. (ex Biomphalaria glabrata)]